MKKMIAIFCAAALAAALFAGCAKQNDPEPTAAPASVSESAADASVEITENNTADAAGEPETSAQDPASETQALSAEEKKAAAMEAYRAEVKRVSEANAGGRNEDTVRFILYDMDLNGIPELILDNGYKTETAADGFGVYTYTAARGLILLGYMRYHGSTLFDPTPGDYAIGMIYAYHGYEGEFDYQVVNNELVETIVSDFHQDTYPGGISEADQREQEVSEFIIADYEDWIPAQDADAYFDAF